MKTTYAVAGLAATAHAFSPSGIFAQDVETQEHRIPTTFESAVIGRRVLALTKLATMSTVFPGKKSDGSASETELGLEGLPIGMMDYVADCEEEGDPTILEIKIATTFKNARAGSNLTISMNWVPPYPPARRMAFLSRLSTYIPFFGKSNYNTSPAGTPDTVAYSAANLPRFALIGRLEDINPDPVEAVKLGACFTAKHHDSRWWLPGNAIHESQWSRLVVEKVYFVGGFGDRAYIGWIPIEEWKSVTRSDWEAIRLPGEKPGWSEWSAQVEEVEDL
ncbi:pyridoxamine 5'-phosphate oxidase-domain-containing protein [Dactylonectria estremocensis]|uniref:Pyridoxamine 5'-phosphate oxidase-domain-containing protein n=1 Tax=Dactylonectria estremocensis TaxID=1079267 RepID=A0A9P9JHF0_9HYPO|nr:pyridoxamine 5'-phosphate oxidase-domain-containing protein [Dactylonectria estremocensis]